MRGDDRGQLAAEPIPFVVLALVGTVVILSTDLVRDEHLMAFGVAVLGLVVLVDVVSTVRADRDE